MDLNRERRFQELVFEVIDLDPVEQARRLQELAPEDPGLVEEVLEQLEWELGTFMDEPVLVAGLDDKESMSGGVSYLPERIGPYVIGDVLGFGGMGEVRRARQEHPVQRDVALKVLRGAFKGEAVTRFRIEQRALARLGHSNVARFIEAGTTEQGVAWFTMELIEGEPLTEYCDHHRLSIRERMELFLKVCAGVEHAHQKQVLHRDLKPSNVLVQEEDGRPIPKVIDFGIAKALDQSLSDEDKTRHTHALLGTPAYMSPEALAALYGGSEVDTRADVYSLGVLLFELLTGQHPLVNDGKDLGPWIRRRQEAIPRTPSAELDALPRQERLEVADQRSSTPEQLVRTMRKDLDWIVLRALAPEMERRYASVGELAADLSRSLRHEPVEARPPNTAYQVGKMLRRHRAAGVAFVIALGGVLLGAVGLSFGLVKARQEAEQSQLALAEAREVSDFLVGLFRGADPNRRDDLSARELLDRGAEEIPSRLEDQPAARGRFLQAIGDVYVQLGLYDRAEPMLIEAQKLLLQNVAEGDPALASVWGSLGVLWSGRQNWPQAEDAFRKASETFNLEDNARERALALHNLGVTFYYQERLDEAEAAYLTASEIWRRALEPDDPLLARSDTALGVILINRGRLEEALPYLERSLEHRRRVLGPEHPHVAISMQNIALAHRKLGHRERAMNLVRRSLKLQEKTLGRDHPEQIRGLRILADLLDEENNFDQLEEVKLRVVEITRLQHGLESDTYAGSLHALADVYFQAGRYADAEARYAEAGRVYEGFGKDHIFRFKSMIGKAAVIWKRGQWKEAEELARTVLEGREQHYGADHKMLVFPLKILAGSLRDQGRFDEAEPLYCRGLKIYMSQGGVQGAWESRLREDYVELLRRTDRDTQIPLIWDQRQACAR